MYYYLCECACGKSKEIRSDHIKSGATSSCGCYHKDRIIETKTTHGCGSNQSKTPEYVAWAHMLSRCRRPKDNVYQYYGARGIHVCDRWLSFSNFLEDMGKRPSSKHQIDRTNNDGNYEPGNCRWVTCKVNSRNTRGCCYITHKDRTMILIEWLEETSLSRSCYNRRLKRGFTILQALGLEPTDKPTRQPYKTKPKPIDPHHLPVLFKD